MEVGVVVSLRGRLPFFSKYEVLHVLRIYQLSFYRKVGSAEWFLAQSFFLTRRLATLLFLALPRKQSPQMSILAILARVLG